MNWYFDVEAFFRVLSWDLLGLGIFLLGLGGYRHYTRRGRQSSDS